MPLTCFAEARPALTVQVETGGVGRRRHIVAPWQHNGSVGKTSLVAVKQQLKRLAECILCGTTAVMACVLIAQERAIVHMFTDLPACLGFYP